MRIFLFHSALLVIFINLISSDNADNLSDCLTAKDKMEYIKLEDLKFEFINIAKDEEIELLSFSGGKNCNDEYTIYKQFIGIRKITGDTVRILAACQTYNSSKLDKIAYFSEAFPNPFVETSLIKYKLVAFNRKQARLENGNFKTCIGELGFPVQ